MSTAPKTWATACTSRRAATSARPFQVGARSRTASARTKRPIAVDTTYAQSPM